MSKRLQVLIPPAEWQRLKRLAQVRGQTVAAWVREALRQDHPGGVVAW
ncbi:MAG: CopG family transcriptional regulator [bacterium]